MTLRTIYIARHGYRSNWIPPPHPPNPTEIDSDHVLAPHGEDQARELAQHVVSLAEKPQFLVSSPFYRCVQTFAPLAAKLGVKIAIDRGVGEWFKRDRGVVPIPASYDTLGQFFANVIGSDALWDGSGVVPSAEGENEADVFARCGAFWNAFMPKFEAEYPDVSTVIIVTHAAIKIALGMQLLQKLSVHDDVEFDGQRTKLRAGACSLDKYTYEDGVWTLRENGRTDFLADGEEMDWNFDAKFEAGSDDDIRARLLANTAGQPEHFEDLFLTIDIPVVSATYTDEPRDAKGSDPLLGEQLVINPGAKLQLTELDHETPLFKISDNTNTTADPNSRLFSNLSAIDGQIYKTSWTRLLGTELIFDDYGTLVGTVKEHLVAEAAVRPHPAHNNPGDDVGDDADSDTRSAFYRKALAAAQRVAEGSPVGAATEPSGAATENFSVLED